MTVVPIDSLVAEFLRRALADHALGVPKLEGMARAAGLLREGQRITHAKVFKRTKKFLGIKSVRNGFGDGGEWLWRLERRPASPVSKRVSIEDICAEDLDPKEVPADVRARRIPSSWIDGVARLDHHRPLTDDAARHGAFLHNLPVSLSVRCRFAKWRMKRDDRTLPTRVPSPPGPPRARAIIVEYVEEKSFGLYGGSRRQQQRFAVRLSNTIASSSGSGEMQPRGREEMPRRCSIRH